MPSAFSSHTPRLEQRNLFLGENETQLNSWENPEEEGGGGKNLLSLPPVIKRNCLLSLSSHVEWDFFLIVCSSLKEEDRTSPTVTRERQRLSVSLLSLWDNSITFRISSNVVDG